MKQIFEQYGDVILTAIVIIAIIAIVIAVLVVNKDTIAGWFLTALQNGIGKMDAQMP